MRTAIAIAIAVVATVADCAPASAQISDDFYYLQHDKPRRRKRPPEVKPPDPNAAVTPGAPSVPSTLAPAGTPLPTGTATPGAAPAPDAAGPEQSVAPGTTPDAAKASPAQPAGQAAPRALEKSPAPAPADKTPAPAARKQMAADDPIDPRVAEIVDALTGPDDAKFEALLNPPPRPGEKPVGQPIETSAYDNSEPVSSPPPIGPDIETAATSTPPANAEAQPAPASEAAGGRTETGVTFVPGGIRGELDERLALEDRARELFDAGRLAEAETEATRLLALLTKDAPPTTNPAIDALGMLGSIDEAARRLDRAEQRYRRALGLKLMQGRVFETEQPVWLDQHEAISLARLASVASAQGKADAADRLYGRALRISARYEHPATIDILTAYARHEANSGQLDKAAAHYQQSLALAERLSSWLPASTTVYSLNSLARVKHAQGDVDGALATFRQAKNVPQPSALAAPGARDAYAYDDFIAVAYERATRVTSERDQLSAEAFEAAQRTKFGEAAAALAQMAARQAQRDGPLAELARQYQDETRKRSQGERQLAALLRAETPDKGAVAETRRSLSDAATTVSELERLFATDFPHYAALANPAPATLAETQALLAPNEALVVYSIAGENSFAWALTRTTSSWRAVSLSAKDISEHVAALRCGLDYTSWRGDGEKSCRALLATAVTYADLISPDASRRKQLPFDLARASALYRALLEPFAAEISGKHLIVVPDGALARLPLSVLVTEKPLAAIPSSSEGYRDARWLGARQPITMLPSVSSLRALRSTARPAPAPEPYLGIGEPTLVGTPNCPKISVPASCPLPAGGTQPEPGSGFARVASQAVATLAAYFRSGLANVDAVRSLCPLPDTAFELLCVSRSLGVPQSRVLVGTAATETAIKHAPLDHYRILHFATHGLLAGETARLAGTGAEPALVLTPPAAASAEDDGLLTASEISELKLNADWVIMSACNTAAGAGDESNEALSGLARAFFYAGARTLLVSHWEVTSQAAVKLTTSAFAELKSDPSLGRAEALRRSMAALIDKGAAYEAHPAYWAPFVIVGDGDAR